MKKIQNNNKKIKINLYIFLKIKKIHDVIYIYIYR